MSTRANIIIKDGDDHLIFYRHSDGYPDGVRPSLTKFLSWIKSGKIRDNISQTSGWLILIGAIEYGKLPRYEQTPGEYDSNDVSKISDPFYWKVGAYEPTTAIHGDIEHLYVVDLSEKTISEIEINSYWKKSRVIEKWT